MMRKFLILLIAFVVVSPVIAQSNCGTYLPCGPVPWGLPSWPVLQSPTPATDSIANAPPGATPTPVPPDDIDLDTDDISDAMATMDAILNATPVPLGIDNLQGTPTNADDAIIEMVVFSETFFGYAKGLTTSTFGPISPLIAFSIFALLVVLSVTIIGFMFPVIMATLGIIRKIIDLILAFLPF